jgi:hypothetical protein
MTFPFNPTQVYDANDKFMKANGQIKEDKKKEEEEEKAKKEKESDEAMSVVIHE